MLMADTVGEIEQSVTDSARSATGGDVVEPHRDQCGGPINGQFQHHNRRTQYLQAFIERPAVEEERLAIILALVSRHFAPRAKMAPIAAGESCGLW
jgi:hypothetical protein